ncbi:MAG: hypothetical protein MJ179_08545 [Treponema sp.]|nr:hypothetical protein [Treponema sp.]
MSFSLFNFCISILGFVPFLFIINYSSFSTPSFLAYFIVIIFGIICSIEKKDKKNEYKLSPVSISLFIKANILDFITFIFTTIIISIVSNFISNDASVHLLYIESYIFIVTNALYKGMGFKHLNLMYSDISKKGRIKVLFLRYIYIFPAFVITFLTNNQVNPVVINIISTCWKAIIIINILTRLLIYKKQSFFEYLLNIEIGINICPEKQQIQ